MKQWNKSTLEDDEDNERERPRKRDSREEIRFGDDERTKIENNGSMEIREWRERVQNGKRRGFQINPFPC